MLAIALVAGCSSTAAPSAVDQSSAGASGTEAAAPGGADDPDASNDTPSDPGVPSDSDESSDAEAPSNPGGAAAPQLIPEPSESIVMTQDVPEFQLAGSSRIAIAPGTPASQQDAAESAALTLAEYLRPATGFELPLADDPQPGDVVILLDPDAEIAAAAPDGVSAATASELHAEAYQLAVNSEMVWLTARSEHGLFNATQTLRQLLPAAIFADAVQQVTWAVPVVTITDQPRFAYRGFMLDIARHMRTVDEVKTLIDAASSYKFNTLRLHLADDQGFRVEIEGFPRLTEVGAQGAVGTEGREKDDGGFWTRAEYQDVVAYAASRFMTVIPEVDTPGHTNAIIMSEWDDVDNPLLDGNPSDINCTVSDPPQWNFTNDVGYSALCPESENTWTIMTAIITQLAADSPGPYYHLGGDEVPGSVLSSDRYAEFMNREIEIVTGLGKIPMGWAEISGPGIAAPQGSLAQYWSPGSGSSPGTATATAAIDAGMQLVMSPANHAYLDMIYAPGVPGDVGLSWACPDGCDLDAFYTWDPVTHIDGVTASDVAGVEATLFAETLRTFDGVQRLVFPRLLAIAELSWSPSSDRSPGSDAYADFTERVAAHGPRLDAAGLVYYATSEVDW